VWIQFFRFLGDLLTGGTLTANTKAAIKTLQDDVEMIKRWRSEIDDLKLESKQTIELVRFVDEEAIDDRYYETPYYLLPDGDMADYISSLHTVAERDDSVLWPTHVIRNDPRSTVLASSPGTASSTCRDREIEADGGPGGVTPME